ncbi:MAG TPA: sugar transferase, partial [Candidatus Woesebacteria bacterium]|nr:sugar transferase [Candidatus Woesebacteria bacterium]
MFQKIFAIMLLFICLPLFILLFFWIRLTSKNNFIFKQKRTGKNKNPFTIYKIQTMIPNAELLKQKYIH